MWEGKNKVKYAKSKADEQRYIQEAYEDIEMAEPEEEEVVNEEENEAEDGEGHEDSAHEDEDNDSGDESFAQGSKNQHLTVGYKNDLSYVTRGDMIGVFAHNGDRLKFRTAIDRIKNVQGKAFSPHKVSHVDKSWRIQVLNNSLSDDAS